MALTKHLRCLCAGGTGLPADASANTEAFLIRKIRECMKSLHIACRPHAIDGKWIAPDDLLTVLTQHNIVISDVQFNAATEGLPRFPEDEKMLSYSAFLRSFMPVQQRRQAEANAKKINVGDMTVEQAAELIRAKLDRLGLGSLRKAFQYFDRDGGGSLSKDEMAAGLRQYLGVHFEPALFDQVFDHFDPDGNGTLDLGEFTRMVMQSSGDDATGMSDRISQQRVSEANGNSDQMLRRKIREKMKIISLDLKKDADEDGCLSPQQLRRVLERHDILFADAQFALLVRQIDDDGDGKVSFSEFLKHFGKGQSVDRQVFAVISGIGGEAAKKMVQEKLQGRLGGGPSGLRRAYAFFDRDGSGSIDLVRSHILRAHSFNCEFPV